MLIFHREFDTENRLLKKNLEEICEKYEELEEIYEQEELSVKSLSDSHKDISSRLLKAARLLIDEKVARQTEKCRLEVVTDELNKLKAEKVSCQLFFKNKMFLKLLFKDTLANKVATLMTELTTLEKQYNSLENDKLEVQKAYERYKQANESTKNEFVSMEQVRMVVMSGCTHTKNLNLARIYHETAKRVVRGPRFNSAIKVGN